MPYKLLLADDSVTIQRVIELTFADEDVKVTAVGDGQAAIDRIQAAPPDIVLADVGMPGRDGYEVAAFVKTTPELAHIPVLLLTGAFEPVDESRAREVQCNGVLAKPFEPQLLIGRVKELLAADAEGRTAAPAEDQPADESSPADETDRDEADRDKTGPVPIARASAADFTAADFSLDTATLGEAPPAPAADLSLDDYFDRLDAAFANLSGAAPGQLKQAVTGEDDSWAPPSPGAWSPADPLSLATAPTGAPAGGAASRDNKAGETTVRGVPGGSGVTVADAFAALLEAEQHEVGGGIGGGDVTLPAPPAPAVDLDALVEQVIHRLEERAGTADLRELVARVVSETAERLVREEIERLKASVPPEGR